MVIFTCTVELVEGIKGYGDGVAGMRGGEAILQGGRSRHGDASQRRRQRARETQHVLGEAGDEDACCKHMDGSSQCQCAE